MQQKAESFGLPYRILPVGILFELKGQYGNSSFNFVNTYS
jgi:hypothetical protein